jgi:cell division protein FtsZ
MATGKRASMREGPLADLFRKTTDEESQPSAPPAASERQQPELAEVEAPVAAERPAPHPSLGADVDSPVDLSRPEAPSPQERLRAAFSSDLPEDMLEPPAALRDPEPAEDVYAIADRGLGAAPPAPVHSGQPVLRVVGVGGAGVNAVNRMVEADINGVEFLAINTDLQSLQLSAADETLHIGDGVTRGLGSGADPELGRRAAREEYDRIKAMLRGSDMVFIAAGPGGRADRAGAGSVDGRDRDATVRV